MDDLGKCILQRQEKLATDRGTWENHWQEIAEVIHPMRADFNIQRQPGAKRMEKIFDGTAPMARENLAAGVYGLMSSSSNVWFELAPQFPDMTRDRDTKLWLDNASEAMRNMFHAGGERFYTQTIPFYNDLVGPGTGIFYSEPILNGPLKGEMYFTTRHLKECYIAQNKYNMVDTLYRRFKWRARQIIQQFGDKAPTIVKKANEKNPEQEFELIHATLPAEDLQGEKFNRPIASAYVFVETSDTLSREGYLEFPYQCARWSQDSDDGSGYGNGPGELALPDTKMLNQMSKTTITAAQMNIDPPLLAGDEMARSGQRLRPGQMFYGGIDPMTGRKMIDPLFTNADVRLGLEMEEQRRQQIREAFYYSLLLMVQQPNMTATEFLGRQEEKIRLMGPHLGRVTSEFLSPLIDRVFAVMFRLGSFGPPPPLLRQYPQIKIKYNSPLARMEKTSEVGSMMRAMEAVKPIAELKPEVLDNIDGDEWTRTIFDGFGAPARILRDPKLVAQDRLQRQQAQTAQMMAELAAPAGAGLKDATQAAATVKQMREGAPAANAA